MAHVLGYGTLSALQSPSEIIAEPIRTRANASGACLNAVAQRTVHDSASLFKDL